MCDLAVPARAARTSRMSDRPPTPLQRRDRDRPVPADPRLLDDRVHQRDRAVADRQPPVGRRLYDWRLRLARRRAGRGEQRHRDPGRCRHHRARAARHRRRCRRSSCAAGWARSAIQNKDVFAWLRRWDRRGAQLGALCTGAHVLARAGLLDGYRCTIHWENLPGFIEALPRDPGQLGPVRDRPQPLHLLGRHRGARPDAAPDRPDPWRRARDQGLRAVHRRPHPRPARPPAHAAAGAARRASPQADPRGRDHGGAISRSRSARRSLAERIGLSRRQLERLFRRHLGRTPAQYYLETRLERARHLLYQTDMPIMSVACATGFVSASHFTTCYRQMFGKTPRAERVRAA